MLVLLETAAGFGLFKVLDEARVRAAPAEAASMVELASFNAFANTSEALAAAASLVEGAADDGLTAFIKKAVKDTSEQLIVQDARLATSLREVRLPARAQQAEGAARGGGPAAQVHRTNAPSPPRHGAPLRAVGRAGAISGGPHRGGGGAPRAGAGRGRARGAPPIVDGAASNTPLPVDGRARDRRVGPEQGVPLAAGAA